MSTRVKKYLESDMELKSINFISVLKHLIDDMSWLYKPRKDVLISFGNCFDYNLTKEISFNKSIFYPWNKLLVNFQNY